jgi:beta-glucosidase/6-phospho-beta-glucosidase/beta-galactosidase
MKARPLFDSWMLGGFECSSQRRADGRRLDLLSATRHDVLAEGDYRALASVGIHTVRDGVRWHLIAQGGAFDWSSFAPMVGAAARAGVRVIWDLCHYGVPDHVDVWSPDFPARFAGFAAEVARIARAETGAAGVFSPINEISYWSWAAADEALFAPLARGRGGVLKRQLVRAAIAAVDAVRAVDPDARFVHVDPVIHVAPDPRRPQDAAAAAHASGLMFESWDLISGRVEPELGGRPEHLDVIGVNYYWDNQWILGGPAIGAGHVFHRPLHHILADVHQRYGRPVIVAETGAEGDNGPGWLRHVCAEVRTARRKGVPVGGVCVYPVLDYPGWENDRHCVTGVLRASADWTERRVCAEMAEVVAEEAARLASPVAVCG